MPILSHRHLPRRSLTTLPLSVAALVALAMLAAAWPARAIDTRSSLYLLLPTSVSETSLTRPGELHEQRLRSERLLPLTRGLQWHTTTDLLRKRYDQFFPDQSQSLNLSTGPHVRLGQMEFAMPINTLREMNNVGAADSWRSASPRLSLALGPNDHIRLEARVSRSDALTGRSKRSTTIAWRHRISDRWSLNTGLSQSVAAGDDYRDSTAEAFAGLDLTRADRWGWSLTSRISGSTNGIKGIGDGQARTQAASLALSTRYPLHGGWWLGGELKASQSRRNDGLQPVSSQSAGIRLYRNF